MTSTSPKLLRIDASSRTEGSHSRRIADAVEAEWKKHHRSGHVLRRDLVLQPIPHIEEQTIVGFYTPAEQQTPRIKGAMALSDELIQELKSATTVLISSPIYNFSVPSALKAWIDQVVRIGHTFSYDGANFQGLVNGPKAVLALAYGAGGYQGPLVTMDHLKPYLTSILNFIGISQVEVVSAEATTADAATVAAHIETAQRAATTLFGGS